MGDLEKSYRSGVRAAGMVERTMGSLKRLHLTKKDEKQKFNKKPIS